MSDGPSLHDYDGDLSSDTPTKQFGSFFLSSITSNSFLLKTEWIQKCRQFKRITISIQSSKWNRFLHAFLSIKSTGSPRKLYCSWFGSLNKFIWTLQIVLLSKNSVICDINMQDPQKISFLYYLSIPAVCFSQLCSSSTLAGWNKLIRDKIRFNRKQLPLPSGFQIFFLVAIFNIYRRPN